MAVINKNIYLLDAQLDKLQQQIDDGLRVGSLEFKRESDQVDSITRDIAVLQDIIGSLSAISESRPLLRRDQVVGLISKFPQALVELHNVPHESIACLSDLSWLVVAKAMVHTLGILINNLLEPTFVLSDELLYWDDVLGSRWYTGLYALQTSPVRLWCRLRKLFLNKKYVDAQGKPPLFISSIWVQFHDIIQRCIYSQRRYSLQSTLSMPLTMGRSEIRRKQKVLRAMKNINASSIGLLMGECFSLGIDNESPKLNTQGAATDNWRNMVFRNVALMETLLQNAVTQEGIPDFERGIATAMERTNNSVQVDSDDQYSLQQSKIAIKRLLYIHKQLLPNYIASTGSILNNYGRPSRLVRYWLPLSMALFSASTVLNILTSRRRELLGWISDIGSISLEFWGNWVVDPIQRLIGTIRHDEKSEIALMSKNSLEADRASLERMVVDFVLDRGEPSQQDPAATTAHAITMKVREGDLTPVLKAYEKDLRTPFAGTVRGDLVRALLIQIQKTKVDVEVAISGIDSLLKSQELVFGFVGLTPGILITYACVRWLYGLLGSRKGLRIGRRRDELRHALRNVHRTLTLSSPTASGRLTHKDHGLLICETEALLQKAKIILTGADLRELQEDIRDLINIQNGVDRQINVVGRIGWTYSRWIQ